MKFLRTQGTSEGIGYYFTDDKNIAEGYTYGTENLYEVFLNIKKPLTLKQKKIIKQQLKKIMLEFLKLDKEALSNYGDMEYEGKDKILNEAVNSEYEYSDNDVDLIASLGNAGLASYENINKIVKK